MFLVFFFKQKTAYEVLRSLVGSEMCIRDSFKHWLEIGATAVARDGNADKLPKLFGVNWFRKGDDGKFLWPGYGENSRVLKWIMERVAGEGDATETAIGHVPTVDAIDRSGLDLDDEAMAVNIESCLPSAEVRDACIDVFNAGTADPRRRRVAAVVTDTLKARQAYLAQAAARDVAAADAAADDASVAVASIVVGDLETMRRRERDLPLDVATVRAPSDELDHLRRRADAWLHMEKRGREEQPEWADEIAWRLARLYEQRFSREEAIVVRNRPWRSTGELSLIHL